MRNKVDTGTGEEAIIGEHQRPARQFTALVMDLIKLELHLGARERSDEDHIGNLAVQAVTAFVKVYA